MSGNNPKPGIDLSGMHKLNGLFHMFDCCHNTCGPKKKESAWKGVFTGKGITWKTVKATAKDVHESVINENFKPISENVESKVDQFDKAVEKLIIALSAIKLFEENTAVPDLETLESLDKAINVMQSVDLVINGGRKLADVAVNIEIPTTIYNFGAHLEGAQKLLEQTHDLLNTINGHSTVFQLNVDPNIFQTAQDAINKVRKTYDKGAAVVTLVKVELATQPATVAPPVVVDVTDPGITDAMPGTPKNETPTVAELSTPKTATTTDAVPGTPKVTSPTAQVTFATPANTTSPPPESAFLTLLRTTSAARRNPPETPKATSPVTPPETATATDVVQPSTPPGHRRTDSGRILALS